MLNWFTSSCELFGLTGQNLMLVVAGGLLFYIVTLAISRWRQAGTRKKSIFSPVLVPMRGPRSPKFAICEAPAPNY